MQTLEMRTESPEILGSLATLSSFYEDNTPAARRQLCATIEKQGLSITQQYLQSAEHVVQVQALKLSECGSLCPLCPPSYAGQYLSVAGACTCPLYCCELPLHRGCTASKATCNSP